MPFALLLFYRVLGILLWVLVLLMLWEKYRIVRGGTLLPAQILDCCKSSQSDTPAQPSRRDALINPRVGTGGFPGGGAQKLGDRGFGRRHGCTGHGTAADSLR